MINIKDITKIFSADNKQKSLSVFDHFSCELKEGTITAILGASGSGKSTLGRIVSGLETDYTGAITIHNQELGQYLQTKRVGMVPQKFANFEWMNVYENITLGNDDPAFAEIIMERLGLLDYKTFYPRELSGGLQQRVAVARALFHKSEVVIFDEPFGGLDEETRLRVLEFVQPILRELKITGIFITHRIEEALYIADRVIVFSQKPVSVVRDLEVPPIARNRDFYFNEVVLGLKKSLLGNLL